MTARKLAKALLLTTSLFAPEALAQTPSLDLGFHPPTDPNGGLNYEPAEAPDTFDWNAALWMTYAWRPVTVRDPAADEVVNSIIEHQLGGNVVFNIGFWKRLAVGLDLPFVLLNAGDDPTADTRDLIGDYDVPGQALGDLKLNLKGTIIRPTSGEFGGFAMAIHERLGLPTGNEEAFAGEGHITSETRLLLEYRYLALGLHGAIGFKARGEQESYGCEALFAAQGPGAECPTTFGHEMPWGLALVFTPKAIGLDDNGYWTWFIESYGYVPASPQAPFTNAAVSQAQLGGGARFTFKNDVSILAGLDAALIGGIGTAPVRATLSVQWAPRSHDQDGDGIPDDRDLCPEDLKEDMDGFEDHDGCPDWDNDDDGVPDAQDQCPNEREDEDGFEDHDGCPDWDNDGDGILDVDDACPLVPGVPSDDPKKRGCPDEDPDKDGVLGAADKCPTQPEDIDGFQDDDGCPDPDNDGDGILDADDACKNEKGPAVPDDPSVHGCPDRDGDRIPDGVDACPDEAGSPDTDPQKHGCFHRVVVTKSQIVINEKVEFALNSARIKKESDGLLDEVAKILVDNPSIAKVEVQGHTDTTGPAKINKRLSQQRADAVMQALIKRGVAKERLVAKGFGGDEPIADNESEEGRAKNRRVQFLILERKEPVPTDAPKAP